MNIIKSLFGPAGFDTINIADYQSQFGKRSSHTLVDVRTAEEFERGHLPGAISMPLNTLTNQLGNVPTDKPVVVVCATGNRSRFGSKQFVRAGHSDVYNLQGGTVAWSTAGNKLSTR